MAIQREARVTGQHGRYEIAEVIPEIQSLGDLVATLETLPTGETIVAVIDTEEGHFLFIW